MPQSGAQTGRGDLVGYSTTLVSPTYINIACLISVDGPGITVGETESTLLASTFKPYVSTLPEGEASLTLQFDNTDASMIAFRLLMKAAPVPTLAWQVTYQDGAVDTFLGFPKSFKVTGVENETRVTATVDIRLTTAITTTGT
jgi:hypothetical protein